MHGHVGSGGFLAGRRPAVHGLQRPHEEHTTMDQMLSGLFGSNDNDDDARRQTHASDFVQRYETGLPHEGYSDEEAIHNYRQVASRLSPQQYEEAAGATFGRMSKEERRELRREMKQRSGGRFAIDSDDPHEM